MPKACTDRVIMFAVIGLVAWGIVILPLLSMLSWAQGQPTHDPASQHATEESKAEEPWLTKDAAGFFTFLLVVIGGFQLGLFYWQLRYMREGMEDATLAAKAATKQARIAEETQTNLQRPYIFVFGIQRLLRDPQGQWLVTYNVANYGSIPAIIEDVWVGFVTSDAGDPPLPLQIAEDHILATAPSMQAGERRDGIYEYMPDGMNTGTLIMSGSGEIMEVDAPELNLPSNSDMFVRIVIQYRGPFSKGHETGALWLNHSGTSQLVLRGGDQYNYNR
jgi:hypothetical protein